jgi:hypothetical protein
MSVHFFIPDQRDAWSRIDHALMAKRSGYGEETAEALWTKGLLSVHEMATDTGSFGYLVLTKFDLCSADGPELHVMWCQVRPTRALRDDHEWLYSAVEYLKRVAKASDCTSVRIAVAEDHPSASWKWRLNRVGFKPVVTQLGISVTN